MSNKIRTKGVCVCILTRWADSFLEISSRNKKLNTFLWTIEWTTFKQILSGNG